MKRVLEWRWSWLLHFRFLLCIFYHDPFFCFYFLRCTLNSWKIGSTLLRLFRQYIEDTHCPTTLLRTSLGIVCQCQTKFQLTKVHQLISLWLFCSTLGRSKAFLDSSWINTISPPLGSSDLQEKTQEPFIKSSLFLPILLVFPVALCVYCAAQRQSWALLSGNTCPFFDDQNARC